MPGEALLDAPVEETVDSSVDTGDAGAQTDDSSAQTGDSTQQDDGAHGAQDDTAPVISDANGQLKLSETAKAKLDEIKAENPRLAREMRAALFDRQMLAQKGLTVKQALETIESYEAEGGSEAVQQVKAELGQWKDLDADFQAGKPEFVNDIASGNPEAFTKLAPVVMSKFSELAPEHFAYEVAKVFASDMAASDVVLTMRLMQREIGLLPEASRGEVQKLWTQLAAYVDRVNGLAKTPPKAETKPADVPRGTSEPDNSLTVEQFAWERAKVKEAVTRTEFEKNAAGRKLSEERVSAIQELYENALDRLVKAIPGHTAKVDRFLAAKDKAGYRKHMEAAIRSKAPEAMAAAFRKAGIGAKPGPVAKPVAKPAPGAAKPAQANAGFTRTATKPDKNQIDWPRTKAARRTDADANRYVMRNGEKLIYQR
jgi:hypothetical protein